MFVHGYGERWSHVGSSQVMEALGLDARDNRLCALCCLHAPIEMENCVGQQPNQNLGERFLLIQVKSRFFWSCDLNSTKSGLFELRSKSNWVLFI